MRGRVETLVVRGGHALSGTLRVPGDKSVSHRAVLIGALAAGRSTVTGLSDGDDVGRTVAAVRALGASVETDGGTTAVGGGADALHAPAGPVDAGNSGTTARLLAGLVAGFPWTVEIGGDASLSARPMDRVAEPLRAMGAAVEGRGPRCQPPITVRGGSLRGIDYRPPVASAQVKSAVLLAGLRARGDTVVRERVRTRAHTEELLALAGAAVEVGEEDGERVVRVRASALAPFVLDVPGDPSQAAFWVVAATVVPASAVRIEGVYVGPERRGFLEVLARMGASVEEHATGAGAGGMPVADLVVRAASLHGTEVDAGEITGLDEVPVLAVAAAAARGTTVFHDVGELRVKESDRLAGVAALVRAVGASAVVSGDDLAVTGSTSLRPATVDAGGDHRMAMAAAVAGLAAAAGHRAPMVVGSFGAVATSYPGFAEDLAELGGVAEPEPGA
jgi:3-phosphoshikimate 1-carboxyvinyltransferase